MMRSAPNPGDKVVLLLGDVKDDGVVGTLRTLGRGFLHRILHSKSANWARIVRHFAEFRIHAVVAKITVTTLVCVGREDYDEMRQRLFESISKVPHQVFVFEDVLSGKQRWDGSGEEADTAGYVMLPNEDIARVVRGRQILLDSKLNLVPYRSRAEVTIAAQAFLEDNENGVLFRIYVPTGRLWAEEVERLLTLFRDYLAKVAKLQVRLDQVRTNRGMLYIFYGEGQVAADALPVKFGEFSHLLDLCVDDTDAAAAILRQHSLAQQEVIEIITRYSKEARRLQVDLRQERELKVLSIRHRLESELADIVRTESELAALQNVIDKVVPPLTFLTAAGVQSDRLLLPLGSALTVNVQPQFIEQITGVVAREIRGDVTFSERDEELLVLFKQLAGEKAAGLASQLSELKDESAPKSGRIRAGQAIKAFLIRVADKIGEVAVGVLQKYVEKQMGL